MRQDPTPIPDLSTEATPRPRPAAPFLLRALAEDSRTLDVVAFEAVYGSGFLLHQGVLGRKEAPKTRGHVTLISSTRWHDREAPGPSDPLPFVVYPLRGSRRSPFPSLIAVGRKRGNDVVLDDASVSKLHAFLQRDGLGRFGLWDARSTNGTFVNDLAVPVHLRGEPVWLESGAVVRFGGVELTYLGAEELRALAQWGPRGS